MAATPRQVDMINKLLAERVIPERARTAALAVIDDHRATAYRGGQVSRVIDALLQAPKKPAAGAAPGARMTVSDKLKASVPCARYVLEADDLAIGDRGHLAGQPHGFYEVREFKDTRYIRQLLGAPGGYSRRKLEGDQTAVISALIAVGPLKATQRYSAKYSVCSACGSELTDAISIRWGLGPTCRGRFGL